MKYVDLTLQDGGSGVSDYDLLTNQPQINGVTLTGNKTNADLNIQDIRILPNGYTINVATDESGDFTTIQEALNSLIGKLCVGRVYINVASGTYNFAELYSLNDLLPAIEIAASDSNNKPIFKASTDVTYPIFDMYNMSYIKFTNIIFQGYTTGSSLPPSNAADRGSLVRYNSHAIFEKCTFNNFNRGCMTTDGGQSYLNGCTFSYCTNAISSTRAGQNIITTSLTAANCTYLIEVYNNGYCDTSKINPTMTNVTNKYSQIVNTISAQGLIIGNT